MDFNGHHYAGQIARSEEWSPETIRTFQNVDKHENVTANASNFSNNNHDPMESASRDRARNFEGERSTGNESQSNLRSYDVMEGTIPDERRIDGSNWNCRDHEESYDDSFARNEGESRLANVNRDDRMEDGIPVEFVGDCNNDFSKHSKSGINISVVSLREMLPERRIIIKPKYNVSVTRCDRRPRKWNSKGRRQKRSRKLACPILHVFLTTNSDRTKRSEEKEKVKLTDHQKLHQTDNRWHEENYTEYPEKAYNNGRTDFSVSDKLKIYEQPASVDQHHSEERNNKISHYREKVSNQHHQPRQNPCNNCEIYNRQNPGFIENWNNERFKNTDLPCFEDCCCQLERNTYSSNISNHSFARPCESCLICARNKQYKFSSKRESSRYNCFPNNNLASRPYNSIERINERCTECVPFERDNLDKRKCSSCAFCSRTCTPSKASMFVETGNSVDEFCNGKTANFDQDLRFPENSIEFDGNDLERGESTIVRRNKLESTKSQEKLNPNEIGDVSMAHGKKCKVNCKSRLRTMGQSCFDEFPSIEKYFEEDIVRHKKEDSMKFDDRQLKNERQNFATENVNSPEDMNFRRVHECRTRSIVQLGSETENRQPAEKCERLPTRREQKGKFWSQLQGSCKNVFKIASATISQTIKEFSKQKHLSKNQENASMEMHPKGISPVKEKAYASMCEECRREADYREEMSSLPEDYKRFQIHCCRDPYCTPSRDASRIRLHEPQRQLHRSDRYGHHQDPRVQTPSERSWYFDPHEGGIHEDVYPQSSRRGPLKDLHYPECLEFRQRGGSDGNSTYRGQRRKNSNSHQRPRLDTSEYPNASNNRTAVNSKNQARRRQSSTTQNSNNPQRAIVANQNSNIQENQQTRYKPPYNLQGEYVGSYVGVLLKASSIRANYQRRNPSLVEEDMEEDENAEHSRQARIRSYPTTGISQNERAGTSQTVDATNASNFPSQNADSVAVTPFAGRTEMKTPKRLMSESTRTNSNDVTAQRQVPGTRARGRSDGINKTGVPSGKRGSAVSGENVEMIATEERDSLKNDKNVQCQLVRRYQVICVDDHSKKVLGSEEVSCFCSGTKPIHPSIKVTSTESVDDPAKPTIVLPEPIAASDKSTPISVKTIPDPKPVSVPPEPISTILQPTSGGPVPTERETQAVEADPKKTTPVEAATITTFEVLDITDETTDANHDSGVAELEVDESSAQKDVSEVPEHQEPTEDSKEEIPEEVIANGEKDKIPDAIPETEPKNDVQPDKIVGTEDKTITSSIPDDTTTTDASFDPSLNGIIHTSTPRESLSTDDTTIIDQSDETFKELPTPAVTEKADPPKPDSTKDETSLEPAKAIEPTTTDKTTAGKTDSPHEPMTFVREFNGHRATVNVEMQTSNTILTKILSEYDVGNKKKRLLMSIKLQTSSDHEKAQVHENAPKDMEIQTAKLRVTSVLNNQWVRATEYSSNAVTPESGMEINGQAEEYMETEYLDLPENVKRLSLPEASVNNNSKRRVSVQKNGTPKRKTWGTIENAMCSNVGTNNVVDCAIKRNGRRGRRSTEMSTNTENGHAVQRHLNGYDTCGPCGRKKPPRAE